MSPRALLGARLEPAGDDLGIAVIVADHQLDLGRPATCPSLFGSNLVPGLPREFADAVVEKLTGGIPTLLPPAGRLTVDRAGHDEVESTPRAFALAASLLLQALTATVFNDDIESTGREVITNWTY